jgi:large subunit ribosomal protein L32
MPPLPKKKHSRGRKGGRDAHSALTRVNTSTCPSCGAARLPHRACPDCGNYNGRQVFNPEVKEPTSTETAEE